MRSELGIACKPIAEYGIIGNMVSATLVARDGSITGVVFLDSPCDRRWR